MARKTSAIAVLGLLCAVSTALSYTLVLKDGTTLIAREEFEVHGERAMVTLLNGSQTYVPLAQIDMARTESANSGAADLGSAIVLDRSQGDRGLNATGGERSLSDLIRERQDTGGSRAAERQGTDSVDIPQTAAGFPDLQSLRRRTLDRDELENQLTKLLDAAALGQFRIFRGSRDEYVLIELVASTQAEVFTAIELLAPITLEVTESNRNISGLEVLMTSSSRSRSGQFLLTPQNVRLLTKGLMKPVDFFLEHVQF